MAAGTTVGILPCGAMIFTADAVPGRELGRPWCAAIVNNLSSSTERGKLRGIATEANATVVFGHDPDQIRRAAHRAGGELPMTGELGTDLTEETIVTWGAAAGSAPGAVDEIGFEMAQFGARLGAHPDRSRGSTASASWRASPTR